MKASLIRYIYRLFLAGCLTFTIIQCAVTNMNHMSTTNYVDRHITPENQLGQWLMTPIYIPLTIVTLVVDNFIVAPIVSLPSAYLDSVDFWEIDIEGYYASMGVLPFRIVLTPIFFIGDWAMRTIFVGEPEQDAWWAWPEWGYQWQRDDAGRLIGPPKQSEPQSEEPQVIESEDDGDV